MWIEAHAVADGAGAQPVTYAAPARPVRLPFRIGIRTLGHVRMRLVRIEIGICQARVGAELRLPMLPADSDGFLITGLAESQIPGQSGLLGIVRQRYDRCYVALDRGFDAYLGGFSAKSRSTLRRKLRRFADESGGALDMRFYRTPPEIEDFYGLARPLSASTYQERQLGMGLPSGPRAVDAMRRLAAEDLLRAFLLFLKGRPVAYLYLPGEGEALTYAHLGYDREFAHLSPGTVLQVEALRALMDEGRFRLLDFSGGEGQHKALFATGTIPTVDMLLLRPTLRNRMRGTSLAAFDAAVARAKMAAQTLRLDGMIKAVRGR